ncbi:MAG: TipAS antibiotic-recognition domain-containing protein [Oscillospiraceae bacterium]|nr:TipAS antibiotic-recognition domain-containing protein [Oscillospiraceae bacterium]
MDDERLEQYERQAKAQWGVTDAYREYAEKRKNRSAESEKAVAAGLMAIFEAFGKCKNGDPASAEAQTLVKRLQAYVSEHYYRCTPEILQSLGQMYAAGGEFTENIDKAGGPGTAQFTQKAIDAFCE